jgi:hypothetical protein
MEQWAGIIHRYKTNVGVASSTAKSNEAQALPQVKV